MEENKNETPIKKGNKALVAVLAIIIIAILAGVAYYFLKPTSPKDVFVGGINSALNETSVKLEENVDKVNTTITLSGNIESNDEEVKQIAEYINDGKLTYNVQLDKNAKKILVGANIDYKDENLLNGKIFYSNDDNIYFYVQDLFDKYFKVSLNESEEATESFKSLLEGNTSLTEKIDVKKVVGIIEEEISKNLKDDFFSQEKIDGMTKNTMKCTVVELKQVVKNIATSLKQNEEFLNCFEKPEEVKGLLEATIEEIDELDSSYDSKNIEASLFTKGMKNDIEKLEIKMPVSESKEITIAVAEKEKNKFEIIADAGEVGKITLNMEVKEDTNTDLDSVDVSNSVEINNMTQADMMKLYTNLANMKIYKYIAPYLMMQNSSNGF